MVEAHWKEHLGMPRESYAVAEELRQKAVDSFIERGFPTPKLEDWKYTNIAPIARQTFVRAEKEASATAEASKLLRKAKVAADSIGVIALVNGEIDWSLSSVDDLPTGVRIYSLKERNQISNEDDRLCIERNLGSLTPVAEESMPALSTACASDGIAVVVERGTKTTAPLSIVSVSTASEGQQLASYPRLFVHLSEDAESVLAETFVGAAGAGYFNNAVAEFVVSDRAKLTHYRMQTESEAAYHISAIDAQVGEAARLETFTFSFGGKLVRNDIRATLLGEQSHVTLNGLSVLNAEQHVDNTTVLDHAVPNCTSTEIYKGIYGEKSRGVFSGTIIVRQDAQKTNAIQSNQALLLSRDAEIDSRPQLKIWADDVRCTHGATVGQLDKEQLFYLMARGISEQTARDMLIHGFAEGVIDHVETESVRDLLEEALLSKLKIIPTAI